MLQLFGDNKKIGAALCYNISMDDKEKLELYNKQKKLLDKFLSTGAITKEQYQISLEGLQEKMEITEKVRL